MSYARFTWYKNLCFMPSFMGFHEGIKVVWEYYQRSLIPMLMKCYEHLHTNFCLSCWFTICSHGYKCEVLDIIEMASSNSEPIKECVTWKLLQFKRFPIDVKDIKCLLVWWRSKESSSYVPYYRVVCVANFGNSQITNINGVHLLPS